ncbi:alpha-N-acetylglucosaminidase C-terminal domain-containing protein [Pedobacter sp. Du54]
MGDEKSTLNEYSCRQWSGMINGFYKPRWIQYFNYVNSQLRAKKGIDQTAFETAIKKWEWKWVNSQEKYADQPIGNSVAVANQLYRKYYKEINAIFN